MASVSSPPEKPAAAPSSVQKTGVLLCNLGTPDAPTPAAVRRYLAQFLSDPRVVALPRLLWLPILYGAILPFRPAKSAAKYASIWMAEGSPLAHWTQRQALLLRGFLGERKLPFTVRHAMRYGQPSIDAQLDALVADGCGRILVLPLYPQYSSTTTESITDAVNAWAARRPGAAQLRSVRDYHAEAGFIEAWVKRVRGYWQVNGRPDKLVMSFHGVPVSTIARGDSYERECQETARRLGERLGWAPGDYLVTFQSRFGKAKWLEPATEPTLRELGRAGTGRVDVVCPGFPCDCLETLEEIAMEGKAAFLESGGREFHHIPCLNDSDAWIGALAGLVEQHTAGWR